MLQGLRASVEESVTIEWNALAQATFEHQGDGGSTIDNSEFGKQANNYANQPKHSVKTHAQDISLIFILHVSLFWFLANNWQAPTKVEQLKRLQQEMTPKLKAFLYQMPAKQEKRAEAKNTLQTKELMFPSEDKAHETTPLETPLTPNAGIKKPKARETDQHKKVQAESKSVKLFNIKAVTQSYLKTSATTSC